LPIPPFTDDGVLPPFLGPSASGLAQYMSPFRATCREVVERLATSERRRVLSRSWLAHRAALREAGFRDGFQWIGGSFVEGKPAPQDMDVLTFSRRPISIQDDLAALRDATELLFRRPTVRARFGDLDVSWVDLDGDSVRAIRTARTHMALFSHRKPDGLWKGMLEVPLIEPTEPWVLELL
jgi:hypothetical protein